MTHLSTRRTTAALSAFALSGAALMLSAGAVSADDTQGGRPLTASLSGLNEVSSLGVLGVGDLDGSATARVTVNPGKNLVCWEITDVAHIDDATRGHIHKAGAGRNGGIVVDFFEGTAQLEGCATPRLGTTARDILLDPAGYYVNIHNGAFSGGAIRGQLSK